MASTINLVCLFFLITTLLLSSTQTHARDSHFFSKVSRNRDGASTPNQNYYDNNQENVAKSTPMQQEKEEPMFIPQTTQSGYGLYGHESGLDTPSNMDDTKYENQNNFNNNNNNNNYDNFEKYREERNYVPKVQGFSETSYTNNDNVVVPRNYVGENNYNNNNNNDEGEYVVENNYNNNNKKKNGVVEKQGISDTRYLENGKYFYDIHDEKKFDRTNNNEFSYNSNLKNDNYNDFDNNNLSNNNYYNGKGIYPGYQSKFPKEEEFDFDDQP